MVRIIVMGPTESGKTALGSQLFSDLDTDVIPSRLMETRVIRQPSTKTGQFGSRNLGRMYIVPGVMDYQVSSLKIPMAEWDRVLIVVRYDHYETMSQLIYDIETWYIRARRRYLRSKPWLNIDILINYDNGHDYNATELAEVSEAFHGAIVYAANVMYDDCTDIFKTILTS